MARSVWTQSVPNVLVAYMNGGSVNKWPTGDATPVGVFAHKDIESQVARDLFEVVFRESRLRVLPFTLQDLNSYIVAIKGMVLDYAFLTNWLDLVYVTSDKMIDMPWAIRALMTDSMVKTSVAHSSDYIDSITIMTEIASTMANFCLPSGVVSELESLMVPFYPTESPTAPLAGYYRTQNSGVVPSDPTGITSVGAKILTPRFLKAKVDLFANLDIVVKINSILQRVFGPSIRITLGSAQAPKYSAEMAFIWSQGGTVVEDKQSTGAQDTVVPNVSNDDKSTPWALNLEVEGALTQKMVKYFAWGHGKRIEDAYIPAMLNYVDTFTAGDINFGTQGRHLKGFTVVDPSAATAPVWRDIEPVVSNIKKLNEAMQWKYGMPGWKIALQTVEDDVAPATPDQDEGLSPLTPFMGRRYVVDSVQMQVQQQFLFQDGWPKSGS